MFLDVIRDLKILRRVRLRVPGDSHMKGAGMPAGKFELNP